MKKFFKIFLWILVAAIVIGTFVFLYMNSRDKEERYEIVSPTIGNIERSTVLTGKIEPRDEIDIKPQISGIISEIKVEPGDVVHTGDIIANITVIPDASQLSGAENRIKVAVINLENAKLKHDRNTTLYEKHLISREEYEGTKSAYDSALEELAAAEDALSIVKRGVSRYNASQSNTQVRATIDGLVLNVPVKVGSSVIQANTFNDGTTIATIADMNNLIFRGNVDETEVGSLRTGMPMSITIGALPEVNPQATIEYIAPKGTESNGANTFEIKAAISVDPGVNLRAGYSANASVKLNYADSTLLIPESVVEFAADSTFVWMLTDSVPTQKFDRRPITTGISDGINIQVTSGLTTADRLRGSAIKE